MISQNLIEKLENLFSTEIVLTNNENMPVTCISNGSISDDNLELFNKDFKIKLPKDYLNFLKRFNGCTIFNYENLAGFKLLGTENLRNSNLNQEEIYEDLWDESIIVFCEEFGSGDFISFRNQDDGSYEILDCCHDDLPKDWAVISNSFNDFLEKLIDFKGRPYWLYNNE